MHQGECKQQQQDSEDNMVIIFILKVWHQVNTVHQLWLGLSTKHQQREHSVQLSSSLCSPALFQLGTQSIRRVQQLDPGRVSG